jgi:hypothetical protein
MLHSNQLIEAVSAARSLPNGCAEKFDANFIEAQSEYVLGMIESDSMGSRLNHLNRAIELVPDNSKYHSDRAMVLVTSNRPNVVLENYQERSENLDFSFDVEVVDNNGDAIIPIVETDGTLIRVDTDSKYEEIVRIVDVSIANLSAYETTFPNINVGEVGNSIKSLISISLNELRTRCPRVTPMSDLAFKQPHISLQGSVVRDILSKSKDLNK